MKILLTILLLSFSKCFGQLPKNQTLQSAKTLVKDKTPIYGDSIFLNSHIITVITGGFGCCCESKFLTFDSSFHLGFNSITTLDTCKPKQQFSITYLKFL